VTITLRAKWEHKIILGMPASAALLHRQRLPTSPLARPGDKAAVQLASLKDAT
jgi:hypothetical protein